MAGQDGNGERPTQRSPDEVAFARRLGRNIMVYRGIVGGISQVDLAKAAGVNAYGTISRWETGATTMSTYDLTRISKALGVSPCELLEPPFDVKAKVKVD